MSKTLVIVESPTKAKTISKFLGSGFVVESSFGHVRDLPKSTMGVDIDGGTFEPHYIVSKDKTAQVKKLKDAAKKSGDVIFATDEDREGEAISWHLAHILDIDPTKAKRIVFHEITKHAIEEALKHPRSIDQKLVDAQQARRVLDRLVGYELSPLLWKKVARGLSAGRVQSVAVRLVVEREREREAFKSQEYWTINGLFDTTQTRLSELVNATLHAKSGKKLDKFDLSEKNHVDVILKHLEGALYTVAAIEQKETKRAPAPPFTTSTLQQRANSKLGFSAKQTMRVAQQLYEGIAIGEEGSVGLITYMRTDSVNLSDKFVGETNAFIEKNYGSPYLLAAPRRYKTKSKGAQEAHEAIRPTDPSRTPESIEQYLDSAQYRLYSIIYKRAIATQMQDARLNKTAIDIHSQTATSNNQQATYTFRANGQTVIFDGWLALYPDAVKHEMLPVLGEGQPMTCTTMTSEQHFTEPSARYSDATLVKALEEYGIGRPSTYAPTIGTIETRHYVERDDNKRLKPTQMGIIVNDLLVNHFTAVVDYAFTASMEENLDEIALGQKDWHPIISTFYHPFHETIVQKTEELSKKDVVAMREIGTDPTSGKPISVRVGRYGPFVQKGSAEAEEKPTFASLKKDQNPDTITLEEALVLLELPKTLGKDEAGDDIIVAIGRYGPYVKVEKTFYSIKEDDPYTLTLEKAKEIIQAGKEKKAKEIIKAFEREDIVVKIGRYGPYITDGKRNAKIPKGTDPASLDLATCKTLLDAAPPKGSRWAKKGRKKTTKKPT